MVSLFWFFVVILKAIVEILFPDTKIGENIAQQFVGGDLARNLAQIIERLTDIDRQQIPRNAVI